MSTVDITAPGARIAAGKGVRVATGPEIGVAEVEVDGVRIEQDICGFELRGKAGNLPQLVLDLAASDRSAASAPRADVFMTDQVRELLLAAGWCPPPGEVPVPDRYPKIRREVRRATDRTVPVCIVPRNELAYLLAAHDNLAADVDEIAAKQQTLGLVGDAPAKGSPVTLGSVGADHLRSGQLSQVLVTMRYADGAEEALVLTDLTEVSTTREVDRVETPDGNVGYQAGQVRLTIHGRQAPDPAYGHLVVSVGPVPPAVVEEAPEVALMCIGALASGRLEETEPGVIRVGVSRVDGSQVDYRIAGWDARHRALVVVRIEPTGTEPPAGSMPAEGQEGGVDRG